MLIKTSHLVYFMLIMYTGHFQKSRTEEFKRQHKFIASQVRFIIPRGEIKLQSGIKKNNTTNDTTHKIINSNGDSITTQTKTST